jgi:branched-subunit amino acid aminotransferase/4-amino-4-deoxychorismate lyase
MSGGDSDGTAAPTSVAYRWKRGTLELLDYCDTVGQTLEVADSWLVDDGTVLALELHRSRFLASVEARGFGRTTAADPARLGQPGEAERFWEAAIAAIPRSGEWFPRVELLSRDGAAQFLLRLRSAPERALSLVLASHDGVDTRTAPSIKGPDLAVMLRLRTEAQQRGADDAVLLSPDGFVVEGAHTSLLWWRGDTLCAPSPELERVDSVTAKSIITLASALGVEVYYESVTPDELEGLEVWAVNALHGIRIVTGWIDGPSTAEQPGRLRKWRRLLDTLRKPLPLVPAGATPSSTNSETTSP